MSVGVFSAVGQGKISYGNTSAHPAVFNQTYMYAGDAAYDGQPIPTTVLPSGIILQAALYAGTGASSLGLQTSFTLSGANMSAPGVWVPNSMSLIGIAGGSPVYFQFFVWGAISGFGLPNTISSTSGFQNSVNAFYFGTSGLFTAVPSSTIAYANIVNPNPPTSSTLLPGNIVIYGAPEPSSLALVIAGLVIICPRRRNGEQ